MEKADKGENAGWSSNASDIFILLCSAILTLASIALVVLIYVGTHQQWDHIPESVSVLQKGIAALTLSITSGVVAAFGRRYVFSKLSDQGIRSGRVALYSNFTIGNAAGQFARLRIEFLSLVLLGVWVLGLAAGLTVNNSARLVPLVVKGLPVGLPVGSLDPRDSLGANTSLVGGTSAKVNYVVSSLASGVDGTVGLINITGAGGGSVYYPPLSGGSSLNGDFEALAVLNALRVTVNNASSVPSSATKLNCSEAYPIGPDFWFVSADTVAFSFITNFEDTGYIEVSATADVMGGFMNQRFTGNHPYTQFAVNGTYYSLTMKDDQWARQFMDVICTTVTPGAGFFGGGSLLDFAYWINQRDMFNTNSGIVSDKLLWTTVVGTVVGAYSSNKFSISATNYQIVVDSTLPIKYIGPFYGVYVLMANVVVSTIMLVVIWILFRQSELGGDFMNSTRLLLNPLNRPDLFNASLATTIDRLGDPHLLVTQEQGLLVQGSP